MRPMRIRYWDGMGRENRFEIAHSCGFIRTVRASDHVFFFLRALYLVIYELITKHVLDSE
jgi:hypothetical protein